VRIEVTYDDGLVEMHRTDGESALTSDALVRADRPGRREGALGTMMAVRLDLLESEGLRVDVWWWGTDRDPGASPGSRGLPELSFEPGRTWRVVSPELMTKVTSVDIDGVRRVERQEGFLVDLTRFRDAQRFWLGSRQADAVVDQVVALHERIRQAHPSWDDGRVCAEYGYRPEAYRSIAAAHRTSASEGQVDDVRHLVEGYRSEHPGAGVGEVMDALAVSSEELSEVWKEVGGSDTVDIEASDREALLDVGLLVDLDWGDGGEDGQ
jgi:hypothetical protein